MIKMDNDSRAAYFDKLRKEYPLRREFTNYTILVEETNKQLKDILEAFRFNIKIID